LHTPGKRRMRLLLDHNVPKGLRQILASHEVRSAYEMKWAELTNGELLDAAEQAGFDVLITGDKGIRHQQRIEEQTIAIVVLGTTHWPTIRANPKPVREAVERAMRESYTVATFPRPKLRRRPPQS
jgi:predicted nuclease of predicted toxin-antitoxin system